MPNVAGRDVRSVEEIVEVFRLHGDRIRDTYRASYAWDRRSGDPYSGAVLERPELLRGNPPGVVFPWEQVFLAAATCAGSDYPIFAAHLGIALERVEFVVAGVFDPRPEFHGFAGFEGPPTACYVSLHLTATLHSSAPRDVLEKLHTRVLAQNMVLDALRGIPRTNELVVRPL